MIVFFFIISLAASTIGAVCGIGGGVIIKPLLDLLGAGPVPVVSFLSGSTVLAMSLYRVGKNVVSGEGEIDLKLGTPLAIGAAVGGVLGKELFSWLLRIFTDANRVGAIQALCLLALTLGTLWYTLRKDRIRTHRMEGIGIAVGIGLFLGLLSSFLGIGGGPMNLVALFFFFSMDSKKAANNSLYIILISQIASLAYSFATGTIPDFDRVDLLFMSLGGILGGVLGARIHKRISQEGVDRMFVWLMLAIIAVCAFNIWRFSQM